MTLFQRNYPTISPNFNLIEVEISVRKLYFTKTTQNEILPVGHPGTVSIYDFIYESKLKNYSMMKNAPQK